MGEIGKLPVIDADLEASVIDRAHRDPNCYLSNWDHIQDELALLDVRIEACSLGQTSAAGLDWIDPTRPIGHSDIQASPFGVTGASATTYGQCLHGDIALRESEIQARREQSLASNIHLALPRIASIFKLNRIEEQCLLIAFSVEVDSKYEAGFAALGRGRGQTAVSAGLMLQLLCRTLDERRVARLSFAARAPLLSYRLLQLVEPVHGGSASRLACGLRIDPRVSDYLLGSNTIDERLQPVARLLVAEPGAAVALPRVADATDKITDFVRMHLSSEHTPGALVFQLHGSDLASQRATTAAVCKRLKVQLLTVDVGKAASSPLANELPWLAGREAVLLPVVLCIEQPDSWSGTDQIDVLGEHWGAAICHFSQLTFLLGRTTSWAGELDDSVVKVQIELPRPDIQARQVLWKTALTANQVGASVDPGALASRFRLDAEQVQSAIDAARSVAYWRNPAQPEVTADDLVDACRLKVAVRQTTHAKKAVLVNRWDQLVLPSDHHRQLRELCNQARLRHVVLGEWGFERRLALGKGLNALFTGPPGTGKTMAAEVMAAELQADLLKVDLSQSVSKYIGETEKNLDQLFRQAESGHAILFFDEADALFGKRSEVKDAHDRYANIETGYLLQRMEQHEGIVILATNLRNNLDEAFCRRMHFVIEFPFPDETQRRVLWEGLFPTEVPRTEPIDFGFMARQFKVSGGHIRNIGVCAAFLAAAEGQGVSMSHLIQATRREYRKLGWPCSVNDFGPYHEMLKELDG